ncbi:MAG TPA: hypothetical protein DEB47_09900 [Citreicella sp.]|nr:hypothetical protein [Citreicella sp.]
MPLHWLLRMARWVRHPPSAGRVRLVLIVLALCLALYAVERWIGWPEALSPDRLRHPLRP